MKRGKPRKTERNRELLDMWLKNSKLTYKKLGELFGISESQCSRLVKRELEETCG